MPVLAGTVWTGIAIPLFLAGFDWFGVPGLAAASTVSVSGYALTLAILWRRRHTSEGLQGTLGTTVRTAVGSAVAGLAGWAAANSITEGTIPSFGTGLTALVVGGVVAVVVYAAVTRLIGSEEARRIAS